MNLRNAFVGALAASTMSLCSGALAANYLPYGPQNDVSYDTVVNTWGWEEYYRSSYNLSGQSFLLGSASTYVMVGSLNLLTNTFDVLAAARLVDVEVFSDLNTPHAENGSLWYWTPSASFGFAGLGDQIDQNPYDVAGPSERDRLSWNVNTNPGFFNAGGRSGDQLGLTSNNYARVLLKASSIDAPAVPEPQTWALMILGFGAAGAALRRQRAALA